MSEERPDHYMLIGLHKMAAQFGDGLVPELYELLTRRSRMLEGNPNVTVFPDQTARPRARDILSVAPLAEDNILPFPSVPFEVEGLKERG